VTPAVSGTDTAATDTAATGSSSPDGSTVTPATGTPAPADTAPATDTATQLSSQVAVIVSDGGTISWKINQVASDADVIGQVATNTLQVIGSYNKIVEEIDQWAQGVEAALLFARNNIVIVGNYNDVQLLIKQYGLADYVVEDALNSATVTGVGNKISETNVQVGAGGEVNQHAANSLVVAKPADPVGPRVILQIDGGYAGYDGYEAVDSPVEKGPELLLTMVDPYNKLVAIVNPQEYNMSLKGYSLEWMLGPQSAPIAELPADYILGPGKRVTIPTTDALQVFWFVQKNPLNNTIIRQVINQTTNQSESYRQFTMSGTGTLCLKQGMSTVDSVKISTTHNVTFAVYPGHYYARTGMKTWQWRTQTDLGNFSPNDLPITAPYVDAMGRLVRE